MDLFTAEIDQQVVTLHNHYRPGRFFARGAGGELRSAFGQRMMLVTEDFVVGYQVALEEELGVHLIDLSTLGVAELATGGTWAEAQWMADADRLIAAVADVTWVVQSDGRRVVLTTEGTTPRVVMWDLSGVEVPAGAAGDPLVVPPAWEIEVPGTIASTVFSYSWIGVDPLGRYAAVPLERDEGGWTIAVVSAADGALRRVDGVAGPVAFSPDGAFFVGWSQVDQGSQLVVVDVETLERRLIPTPSYAIPSYFMSHEGTEVVVASAFGEAELSIVDASTGETARLGVPLGLWSFSSRLGHDEVWMTGAPADVEGAADQLWRLDLAAGAIEAIPLDWSPGQVVWLPDADLLLLKDHDRPRMVLWDPDAREVTRELDLSLPPGP